MDFINKRFSSFLGVIFYAVIVIVVIRFFIYMLPFVMIVSLVGWLSIKGFRIIKNWNSKRKNGGNIVNNVDIIEKDDLDDLSNKKIIDVDYTDVK